MEIFEPIHKHLILRAEIETPISTGEQGKAFLVNLVHLIGMKPVTEPQSVYVADAGNEGFTGSINLATSHIAYHIWDVKKVMMFDLYSCKDFDAETVIDFINKEVGINKLLYVEMDRDTFNVI